MEEETSMLAMSNDESGIANVTFENERLYLNGQLAQIIGFDDESVLVANRKTTVQVKFHVFTYLDRERFSLRSYGIARAKTIMYEQRDEEALQSLFIESKETYITNPLPCENKLHPHMLNIHAFRILYIPITGQRGIYRMMPCCEHCYRKVQQQREERERRSGVETGPIIYPIGEEG
jgi:hypothetical protein